MILKAKTYEEYLSEGYSPEDAMFLAEKMKEFVEYQKRCLNYYFEPDEEAAKEELMNPFLLSYAASFFDEMAGVCDLDVEPTEAPPEQNSEQSKDTNDKD